MLELNALNPNISRRGTGNCMLDIDGFAHTRLISGCFVVIHTSRMIHDRMICLTIDKNFNGSAGHLPRLLGHL